MKSSLHALPAFGHGLVRQADDLHADLARRDHDLDIDRDALNALKCDRSDSRDHRPPPLRCRPLEKTCTEAGVKQEQ